MTNDIRRTQKLELLAACNGNKDQARRLWAIKERRETMQALGLPFHAIDRVLRQEAAQQDAEIEQQSARAADEERAYRQERSHILGMARAGLLTTAEAQQWADLLNSVGILPAEASSKPWDEA